MIMFHVNLQGCTLFVKMNLTDSSMVHVTFFHVFFFFSGVSRLDPMLGISDGAGRCEKEALRVIANATLRNMAAIRRF